MLQFTTGRQDEIQKAYGSVSNHGEHHHAQADRTGQQGAEVLRRAQLRSGTCWCNAMEKAWSTSFGSPTSRSKPNLFSTFMLCLLAEITRLSRSRRPGKPELCIFIDEAQ